MGLANLLRLSIQGKFFTLKINQKGQREREIWAAMAKETPEIGEKVRQYLPEK